MRGPPPPFNFFLGMAVRHVVKVAPMQSKGLTSDGHPSEGTYQEDDLKKVVQQQVEYYFSKENLSSDKYLSE